MKKLLSIFVFTLLATLLTAQVSKNINIPTAGTLTTLLTETEKTTVTNLTITGIVDARDFKCLRDEMSVLAILDMNSANIIAYSGSDGTNGYNYVADEIPQMAFYNSSLGNKTTLKSFIIPSSVTSIGMGAFEYCSGLTSITLPTNLSKIESWAFYNCSGLSSFNLPTGLKSISDYAFHSCYGLTSILLPKNLSSIGGAAFISCTNLAEYIVDLENPNYSSLNGVLFNKDKTKLISYPCGKTGGYITPSTVYTIGNSSFSSCIRLTSISMSGSNSLTKIESSAFANCVNVSSILLPSSLDTIAEFAFQECYSLKTITIPSSVRNIESSSFYYCSSLTDYIVDNNNPNYSSLNGVLFNKIKTKLILYPAGKLGEYTIPISVLNIGSRAFASQNGLTSIILPNNLTVIENMAFFNCVNLTSLTLPSSLTNIGDFAFMLCSKVKIINSLNPTPPMIGNNCFANTNSVTDVFVPTINAITAYKNHTDWIRFFPDDIIKSNQTTEIFKPIENNLKIYSTDFEILVEGTKNNEVVELFTTTGKKLQSVKSNGELLKISVGRVGVYLIKTEKKTFKLIL